jgi:hypothetical protein
LDLKACIAVLAAATCCRTTLRQASEISVCPSNLLKRRQRTYRVMLFEK